MKEARINETNPVSFGEIIEYQSAGNYEFADVLYIIGSNIYFEKKILHSYDPDARVQLIKTPVYNDATVISQLTCLP